MVLNLTGEGTLTFTVKEGKLEVLEGAVPDPTAMAEIESGNFLQFIDGSTCFGALFKSDFEELFRTQKGSFYDLGGDFMLLGPMLDRVTQKYKIDPEFRQAVDSYVPASEGGD